MSASLSTNLRSHVLLVLCYHHLAISPETLRYARASMIGNPWTLDTWWNAGFTPENHAKTDGASSVLHSLLNRIVSLPRV